ncbi:MAG: hypothetical protein ACLUSL_11900 [Ruminococcus sp.]
MRRTADSATISGYVLPSGQRGRYREVISAMGSFCAARKALWLMEDDTAKISGENNWILSESPLANET